MKKELLKGLTEEQIAKAKDCRSAEELLRLAKEEGVELTEEQLQAVSGGCSSDARKCPYCGSKEYEAASTKRSMFNEPGYSYKCKKCHKIWREA